MTIIYITLKQCSKKDKCINPLGSWLPATAEYFYATKGNKLGLVASCICCWKAYKAQQYQAHCDEVRVRHREYYQQNAKNICNRVKVYTAQHYEERKEYGQRYREANREQLRVKHREYEAEHRHQAVQRVKKMRQADPEYHRAHNRARRAKAQSSLGRHTSKGIRLLLSSQKGLCWYCGKHVGNKYHVDHRIPLARGGSNEPENLCITCPACNLSKGAKLPHEWSDRLL